jgi:hypothetical protein
MKKTTQLFRRRAMDKAASRRMKCLAVAAVLSLSFVPVGTLTALLAQDETTHQLPLSAEEQQQVIPHLGRLFKDLVDIRRGPERFEAYLHPKLQFYEESTSN